MLPGGKGANQALAARHAGAEVALYGAVGEDAFAVPACALLKRGGVDLSGVVRVSAATGVALIHVDAHGENAITVIPGANALARSTQVPDDVLCAGTVLVMQLETPLSQVFALSRRARARGVRVVLNAAPSAPLDAEVLASIDVLVVNEGEAAALAAGSGINDPIEFAETCNRRCGCTVIVTRGARGAVAIDTSGHHAVNAPPIQVVDSVGAGDAFVGAFAAALDRGEAPARALREGVAAGSLACTAAGAQIALPGRASIAALADKL
jgi:ribokinase